ncbi:hypothetical protein ACIGJO_27330 [Streptomyces sp. NPDC079020]|uniref:hypothetical protein n=1 Tax=Streptomyces sp. NPDC079020 TaxID=3365722 RepID=UPI0037CCDC68
MDAWLSSRNPIHWSPLLGGIASPAGMTIIDGTHQAFLKVPASGWTPAVEPGG